MARSNKAWPALAAMLATSLSLGIPEANAGDDIPTLETVVAQADSVQAFYMMLAPMIGTGLPLELDQIDPIDSEDGDCERLRSLSFTLGCSANGVQEHDALRSKNSYAAGSSMYQLLEYQGRGDTGLFAASDIGSALNRFEWEWSKGGDLQTLSTEFFESIWAVCDSQYLSGASQANVNACIRASGQFLTEMAHFINPQTRNIWVDRVLADTLQVRPTWSGVSFSFSYRGVSSSFGFESIPSAIPDFKENLYREWTCKRVRQERQEASCPIV